jgi:hypothetical protein
MKVTVSASGTPKKFTVSASVPNIVNVSAPPRNSVTISVVRDGRDGKSAYQTWLDAGNVGTEDDYLAWTQAPAIIPTLEQARAEDNILAGKIDMGNNTIINLAEASEDHHAVPFGQAKAKIAEAAEALQGDIDQAVVGMTAQVNSLNLEAVRNANPAIDDDIDGNGNTISNIRNAVTDQEPATLAQVNAAKQEAKDYADTVSVNSVRWVSYWDFSGAQYPSGITGGIRRGDEFEANIGGTLPDGTEIEVGDVVRARIATPGQIAANWSVSQGNTQQALENRRGTLKIAAAATVCDKNSVNDADAVTTKKLWLSFVPAFLANAWTWDLKQIFISPVRFASVGASQYLKVDGNKDITGVNSIPAADVSTDATRRFISDTEKAQITTNTTDIGSKISKSVGATYTTNSVLTLTQAEYDAIGAKSATTLYFIV